MKTEWEEEIMLKVDEMLNGMMNGTKIRHSHHAQLDVMLLYLTMRLRLYEQTVPDEQNEALQQLLDELKNFQQEQADGFDKILRKIP